MGEDFSIQQVTNVALSQLIGPTIRCNQNYLLKPISVLLTAKYENKDDSKH